MSGSLRRIFSPAVEFAKWYERTARKHPFAVGFITSGIKTSVADIFAQKVFYFPCLFSIILFSLFIFNLSHGICRFINACNSSLDPDVSSAYFYKGYKLKRKYTFNIYFILNNICDLLLISIEILYFFRLIP